MFKATEKNGRQRFTSFQIGDGLLLLILWGLAQVAMGQTAPAAAQKLTLTGAVELALKQNLDLQIANIETATRQQERVIARSELLPHAGFDANEAITRYNAKAQLGVQPSVIPHDVGPYQAIH